VAEQGAGLKGVRRLAFVNSWDWDGPLEAGTPTGVLLGSWNPYCKSTPVGSAGPVKVGTVQAISPWRAPRCFRRADNLNGPEYGSYWLFLIARCPAALEVAEEVRPQGGDAQAALIR